MLQPSWRSPSLNTDATGAALPDAFGPFRVLQRIATGTQGPVFHAYDEQRDRHVAAKLFTLGLPPDRNRQLIAAFEELITADLVHPGIAIPVATGLAGPSVYLAHEFVDAEAFDAIVRQYGPAPPDAALRVATQIAGALDFAAAVNIIHGAMHPADVLILSDETRLTGLGVARALEQLGIVTPVRRPYSAPERARGAAWDRRADVYTLAVLLWELLCGRPLTPSAGEPSASLPDIPGIDSAKLREALARALADNPDDRFPTALEFVEAAGRAFPSTHTAEAVAAPVSALAADRRQPVQSGEPVIPIGSNPPVPSAKDRSLDFELRAAEKKRYADAEVAPAVAVESIGEVPIKPDRERRGKTQGHEPAIPLVVPDSVPPAASARSRSMGPLAIILVLGIGLGFGVGYAFKRQSPPEPQTESSAPQPVATATPGVPPIPPTETPPAATPPASSGREFTENAIPPRPSPDKPAVPVEPRAKNDPETRTDVEGRVLIRSEPAGATVIVDGREYGITPAVVRGLGRGNHRIRLVRDGYVPEERVVQISRAQPAPSLVVTLESRRPATERVSQATAPSEAAIERYTGALVVESLPVGATVYLDNKSVGKTPLTLSNVHAGEHVIRLERDGYRRWSRSVRVVATERNRVTASLER
jgi:eukaryotic-like serine/threonine-protein kinase